MTILPSHATHVLSRVTWRDITAIEFRVCHTCLLTIHFLFKICTFGIRRLQNMLTLACPVCFWSYDWFVAHKKIIWVHQWRTKLEQMWPGTWQKAFFEFSWDKTRHDGKSQKGASVPSHLTWRDVQNKSRHMRHPAFKHKNNLIKSMIMKLLILV